MKNSIKKVFSAVLCIAMLLGAAAMLFSCDKEPENNTEKEENNASVLKTAVRVVDVLSAGKRLVKSNLQLVTVPEGELPENTLASMDEAIGKYLITDVCPGDYILSTRIQNQKPELPGENSNKSPNYVIVTEHLTSSGDVTEALQKIIDANPNKTLYFPDGTYTISKPLTTSADPAKTVSLVLSQYAVIQAADNWSGEALLIVGADGAKSDEDAVGVGSGCLITGGTFNANKKTNAIKVAGGRDVVINHTAIKNFVIGIHIAANYVDVDSVVGAGANTPESIGVLIEGSYNTLTNMRIVSIVTGIKLTAPDNVLRNVHPLCVSSRAESCGFWDTSSGNIYDYCYSDQFASGFRLADNNASVLSGCFCFWYALGTRRHWGIECQGRFNSLVKNTRIDMSQHSEGADNAYIVGSPDKDHPNGNDDLTGTGVIIDSNSFNRLHDEHESVFYRFKR